MKETNKKDDRDPIKFIWERGDTFKTIHTRLLGMEGTNVVNKKNAKAPITIFRVGEIEEMSLSGIGDGFFKFFEGDLNYASKEGSYNFRGMKVMSMWGFIVEFGFQDKDGTKTSSPYRFMIPKEETYEIDVKKNSIMIDENHPFVFYQLND